MPKHRPVNERLAELEARRAALLQKQAQETASSDPEIAALIAQRDETQKGLREAKKLLGNGPQSANARREKHLAWIAKIDALESEAQGTVLSGEAEITLLEREISQRVAQFIADQELTNEASA